jgi:hypothetical protein
MQRRNQLPTRWAAIVRCDHQTMPDAERNTWFKSLSFIASDSKTDRKLEWRRHVVYQSINDSFPWEWGAWKSGKEYVIRQDGSWVDYNKSHKKSVNTIDPLSVFVLGPSAEERGISDSQVEVRYFASFRVCMGSFENKKGTVGVWSVRDLSDGRQPCGEWILFDRHGSPIEFVFKLYPKPTNPADWNPEFLDASKGRTMIRNTIEYSSFSFRTQSADGEWTERKLNLPTSVLSSFTFTPEDSSELVTSIAWKFGDQVPDSIFKRPTDSVFPVLEFEGIDLEIDE